MPRYRRVRIEGGWFFFTVTLADRSSDLLVRHVERLRAAYARSLKRDPFETIADDGMLIDDQDAEFMGRVFPLSRSYPTRRTS